MNEWHFLIRQESAVTVLRLLRHALWLLRQKNSSRVLTRDTADESGRHDYKRTGNLLSRILASPSKTTNHKPHYQEIPPNAAQSAVAKHACWAGLCSWTRRPSRVDRVSDWLFCTLGGLSTGPLALLLLPRAHPIGQCPSQAVRRMEEADDNIIGCPPAVCPPLCVAGKKKIHSYKNTITTKSTK
jgi:hypothetical protein